MLNSQQKAKSLTSLLMERAALTPDKRIYTFLKDGECLEEVLSFKDLDIKAREIAALLQMENVVNTPIIILYQPGLEYIAAFFGIMYAGAIPVPLYPPANVRSLERIIAVILNSGARITLISQSLYNQFRTNIEENSLLKNIKWLFPEIDCDAKANFYKEYISEHDTIAFLQYTSGSTGNPKGVMVTHANLLSNLELITCCGNFDEESKGVIWLPPYHDMGLIGGLLTPVYFSGEVIFLSPFRFLQKPFRWLNAISRYKANISAAPDFAYNLCVQEISAEQKELLDLNSWQITFNGAEPVKAETMEKFYQYFKSCGFKKETFYPCYGMAETTLIISGGNRDVEPVVTRFNAKAIMHNRVQEELEGENSVRDFVSCGTLLPGYKSIIVNPRTLRKCSEDAIGEIWVSGASVAKGYWNNEQSESIFSAYTQDTGEGPFLRTGDLGFFYKNELYITGRLKDLIIIAGKNHYPHDIEQAVERSHPAISNGNSLVFSIDMENVEKCVILAEISRQYINGKKDDEIFNAIKNTVFGEHGLTCSVIALLPPGQIPKTSSGKKQRNKCKQQYQEGNIKIIAEWRLDGSRQPVIQSGLPENERPSAENDKNVREIESLLKRKIAERRKVDINTIDISESFGTFGLTSIDAIQLAGELEEFLHDEISPTVIFDYPNIRKLSCYLANKNKAIANELFPITNNGCEKEGIAVVGIGCRFPGNSVDCNSFWNLLESGISGVIKAPPHRAELKPFHDISEKEKSLSAIRWGGFLNEIDSFDAQFFGLTPREVELMDPQQRLLLEVTWEALEHGGISPELLEGSRTGVYIGISSNDYCQCIRSSIDLENDMNAIDSYLGTGNAHSIAANRLSYFFNFTGPCMAIDTACSSSLAALHHAVKGLKNNECDMAICGGVNLIASPELSIAFARAGMLADDGRCKAFDSSANGYVRGEGCGVVILKRLPDAKKSNNMILAIVKGTAMNQDGRTSGITAPNGLQQLNLIQTAIQNANVKLEDIDYIEAHGTGTKLGDPIEVNALCTLFKNNSVNDKKCYIGSVKSNIGHLEAAAGIAGLIKTILILQKRSIPQQLHLNSINPLINIQHTSLHIPNDLIMLQKKEGPLLGGVSSFGFGGTNTHVILESPDQQEKSNCHHSERYHLLCISARTQAAFKRLLAAYEDFLQDEGDSRLPDICYTANTGRKHFEYRAAFIACSIRDLKEQIHLQLEQPIYKTENATVNTVFVFTEKCNLDFSLYQQLYRYSAVFRRNIGLLNEAFSALSGFSLTAIVDNHSVGFKNPALKNKVLLHSVLFCLEYAFSVALEAWGVKAVAVTGDGFGEYVAAVKAGIFTSEEGLRLIAERAKIIESMKEMDFSSGQMEPVAIYNHTTAFNPEAAQKIDFKKPVLDILAGTEGILNTTEVTTSDFWCRYPVLNNELESKIRILKNKGYGLFLELGTSASVLNTQQDHHSEAITDVPEDTAGYELLFLMKVLYSAGIKLNWEEFYQSSLRNRVTLPSYPWQKKSYWYHRKTLTAGATETKDNKTIQKIEKTTCDRMFYRIEWVKLGNTMLRGSAVCESVKEKNNYLIFSDESGIGSTLLGKIKDNGDDGVIVYQATKYEEKDGHEFYLDPLNNDHCQRLFAALHSTKPWSKVIYLWSTDMPDPDNCGQNTIEELYGAEYEKILNVIHGILQNKLEINRHGLWFATMGSVALPETNRKVNLIASTLWGFCKALSVELMDIWGGLIDFEPDDSKDYAHHIYERISMSADDTFFHIAKDTAYVPRLIRKEISKVPSESMGDNLLPSQATYLVTGGTGYLGRLAACWLAQKGAKHIILTSRSGNMEPAVNESIEKINSMGAEVMIIKSDVTKWKDMEELFSFIKIRFPPLRGIIHSAGTFCYSEIEQMNIRLLKEVLLPKIAGTWHLHKLTCQMNLDFFICFSSIAAILGWKGHAHYGAANYFLDMLSYNRRVSGLPATSIDWGPWEGGLGQAEVKQWLVTSGANPVSSAAEDTAFRYWQSMLNSQGINPISPETGIKALDDIFTANPVQLIAGDINWVLFHNAYKDTSQYALFDLVCIEAGQETPPVVNSFCPLAVHLSSLPLCERKSYMVSLVQKELASIMRLDDPVQLAPYLGFFELGLDSIMAMELKRQLDKMTNSNIPTTLLFNYKNINELSDYLLNDVLNITGDIRQVSDKENTDQAYYSLWTKIDKLNEEEVETLINNKFNVMMGRKDE